ncbi:MAG: HAD-IC family P-type ATPase [Armatimonadetes bacterium]|nr:HAD-IC family P-type ATPase [Armatimonadota bacterium]MDW8154890.1 HAD-IC family P-type ATPase [Armatimonadota bacterium]
MRRPGWQRKRRTGARARAASCTGGRGAAGRFVPAHAGHRPVGAEPGAGPGHGEACRVRSVGPRPLGAPRRLGVSAPGDPQPGRAGGRGGPGRDRGRSCGIVLPRLSRGGVLRSCGVRVGLPRGGQVPLGVGARAGVAVRAAAAEPRPPDRPDGSEEEVPAEALQPGDLVHVRPGERVPADGVVVEGSSAVDESLLTGEPLPVDKLPGDELIGGSLNTLGSLVVRVTRAAPGSFLASVARHVAEARALKPGILRLVDRVLLWFVPAVFAASAAGVLVWTAGAVLAVGRPEWVRAAFAALTALVMGYPCALGMATPLAIVRASAEAAGRGILTRSGEALQLLGRLGNLRPGQDGHTDRGKAEACGLQGFGDHTGRTAALGGQCGVALRTPWCWTSSATR